AESRRRFDLGNGPLFAVRLLRVAEDSHVLVLSLHHIAADAVSTTVLTRDLSELYAAQLEDRAVQLPELERRPADFAAEAAAAETDPQSLKYWREQLSGELPVLRLPEDRPRPATPKFTSRAHVSVIGEELSRGLRELSARSGTTLFMTLLAGLAATLQRFSPADDVVVGVPASQRPEGSEDLVGCFVNTLALRFDLSGDPAFTELLKRVRRTALDAHDHADVPFDEVVEAVGPPDDATRTPIFQVLAEYKSVDTFALDLPGVEATPLDAGREAALTDLALFLTRRGEETVCHVEYNAELFDAATIERISGYFQLALSAAVADPDSPLSRLVGLSEPDRNALTAWQHGEDVPIPATSVPEMLAAVAHHCPDAAAVAGDDALLTYRELDAAANRLAGRLAGFGVEPGETVAVWMPRSARLVTALLAVLKTGAAYLPLDPGLGPARVKTVLTDSRARLVLTSKEAAAALPAPRNVEVMVDDPAHDPEPPWEIPRTPQAGDAAYVIYTSGSTGRPKGVAVSHRGLTNLCQWFRRRFDFTPADRAAAVCGQSFDASVLEVWPALAAGASVLIAPESVCADAKDLAGWYARVQATFTLLPTALGEEILALPEAARLPLSTMVLGGDVLRRRPPGGLRYEVVNAYGPAEATVLASTHSVAPQGPDSIPIGRPVDNTRLYVLDHAGRPAPVGVVGELFIGGPCVANGYLHAPELTALRFIADPGGGQDDRLYRTGDLVRWNSDGELEFRGRVDDQLKVRGFRVEPGDATQALKASPDVADGVVLGKRGPDGEAYLAGYLVPGNADVTPETTMDAMRTLVPEYLVPQAWAVVEALPRDASGKLRRDALPETTALVDAPRPARDHSAGPQGLFDEVRTLWASMLGRPIEDVRADSDFFALGGHAVVLRLLSQARERFDVSYPVVEFYQKPTVAAMVEHIGRAGASAEDVVESGPVSFQQNATVREAAEAPEGRNTTLHMNLGGDVDAGALRTALTAVAERHQSLRTRFTQIDGAWTQEVLANGDQELPVVDLRHLSPPQALTRADELCDEAAGEVMTPAEGRLWRSRLLRLAEDRWRLLIVVHHAVCDGWSTTVLLRDLAEAYAQARAGKAVELPSATQSIDYARWQLMQHDQTVEAERIQYWKRRLNGSTVDVAVPADRPPSSAATASAHFVRRRVDGAVIASVNDLARRQGCTEFAVWAAALGVLISRLDGSSRLALGVPHAARESAEHDSVVSVLTSVSILGMDLSGDICFADLVAAVVRDYFEGIDSFVPLRRLLDALAAERGDEIPKTMPVMLTYQGALDRQVSLPDLAAEVEERTWLAAGRRQLTFFVEPDDGQWNYGVVCNGDIYDPATPEGWMRQWLRILAQGVAAPETPVSALLG
ncbi:MAG: non-ribosomal peptide synthetase, partial [Stackebrandtia sp.]